MDRQNAFREQEMNMGIKVKKILTGTALIMSLCMFTACGNANKAADEADTNEENMTDNNAANDDNMENNAGENNTNGNSTSGNNAADKNVNMVEPSQTMELPQRMKLQKMRQNRIAMQQITLQIIPELMKTTTVTAQYPVNWETASKIWAKG